MAVKIIDQFTETDITLASSFSSKFTTANVQLFSHEDLIKPINDDYKRFNEISEVREYFVPSSRTYKMANILFQNLNRNITSAGGSIFLFPITDTSATQTSIETVNLTANLTNILGVNDGEFEIIINGGTPIQYQGLDFTRALSTIDDIQKFLSLKIPELQISLVSNTKIKFTNPTFGSTSTIVIQAIAGGTGTDITGATFFNIAGATEVQGTNSTITSFKEQLLNTATLQNDLATVPVITTLDLTATHIQEIANYIENDAEMSAEKKIFFYCLNSTDFTLSTNIDYINTNNLVKTFLLQVPAIDIESMHNTTASTLATILSVNYFEPDSQKFNIQAKTIDPMQQNISLYLNSIQNKIYQRYALDNIEKGVNAYFNIGSIKGFAMASYTRGTQSLTFDQKLFEYNFENYIDTININEIFQRNNLSMADSSIQVVSSIYEAEVLNRLLANNVLTPFEGTDVPFTILPTNASKGLKEAEKNSMKERGYFIYATPIQSLSESDKTTRTLRFSFLLHTPAGLLKIKSVGIAFDK